jgi:hypothetical protein
MSKISSDVILLEKNPCGTPINRKEFENHPNRENVFFAPCSTYVSHSNAKWEGQIGPQLIRGVPDFKKTESKIQHISPEKPAKANYSKRKCYENICRKSYGIILTTIFVLNNLHALKFTCLFRP